MDSESQTTQFGINDMLAMPRLCGHCGMIHGFICPHIRAIEYYPDGTVKRVEYHGIPPAGRRDG
jgi:hypothetical protein